MEDIFYIVILFALFWGDPDLIDLIQNFLIANS